MPTRVEYDNTGWYVCHYDTMEDMMAETPIDTVGPYDTMGAALRMLAETRDHANENTDTTARKRAYDPSRDPTPAAFKVNLDAGIPTDDDEFDETSFGESV